MVHLPGDYYCEATSRDICLYHKKVVTDKKTGEEKIVIEGPWSYSDLPGVIKGWQAHYGRSMVEEGGSIENIMEMFLLCTRAMTKSLSRILSNEDFDKAVEAFRGALRARGKNLRAESQTRSQGPSRPSGDNLEGEEVTNDPGTQRDSL